MAQGPVVPPKQQKKKSRNWYGWGDLVLRGPRGPHQRVSNFPALVWVGGPKGGGGAGGGLCGKKPNFEPRLKGGGGRAVGGGFCLSFVVGMGLGGFIVCFVLFLFGLGGGGRGREKEGGGRAGGNSMGGGGKVVGTFAEGQKGHREGNRWGGGNRFCTRGGGSEKTKRGGNGLGDVLGS